MKDFTEELILRYLRWQLPTQERAAFEDRLAKEPELAKETALVHAELDAIELLVENDLRKRFKVSNTKDVQEPVYLTFHRKLLVAASTCLMVGLCLFLWHRNKEVVHTVTATETKINNANELQTNPLPEATKQTEANPTENIENKSTELVKRTPKPIFKKEKLSKSLPTTPLLSDDIEPAPIVSSSYEKTDKIFVLAPSINTSSIIQGQARGEDIRYENEKLLRQILNAESRKDYITILRLAASLPDSMSSNKHWLQGQAHFRLRDYGAAVQSFKALLELNDEAYRDRDEWMYLLAILSKNGNKDTNAMDLINKISKDKGNQYFRELSELKEILK